MLLRQLSLENIRSYTAASITFQPGSTLLLGDVGAGKSTVLLAIEFALFGISEQSGMLLLRHGTKEGSVTLSFSINDKDITVKRTLKRHKNGIAQQPGLLTVDGQTEQYTPMELKAHIIAVLGYPAAFITKSATTLYRYTVYCPQEEMSAILDDSSEDRLTTLRVIFSVDKYQRIVDNATALLRDLRQDRAVLHARTEHLDAEETKRAALQETLAALNEQLALLDKQRTDLDQTMAALVEQLLQTEAVAKERQDMLQETLLVTARLQEKQQRLASLHEEQHVLDERKAQLSHQLTDVPPAEELRKLLDEKEHAYQTALVARRSWQEKLQAARTELERYPALKERHAQLEQQQQTIVHEVEKKHDLERRRSTTEQELARTQAELAVHEHTHEQHREKLRRISSLITCPMCEQKVTDEHRQTITVATQHDLQEQHVVIGVLRKQREEQRMVQARLQEQLSRIEEQEQSLAKLMPLLSRVAAELARLDALREQQEALLAQQPQDLAAQARDLKALREQYDKALLQDQLKQRLAEIDERQHLLDRAMVDLTRDVQALTVQRETLRERLNTLPVVDVQQQKHDLDALKAQERLLLTRHAAHAKEASLLQEQHALLDESITRMRQEKQKLLRVQRMLHWIDAFFIPAITTIEKQIMFSLHQQCDEAFKHWCGMLLSESLLTARLDDLFSPIIEQNGFESTVGHLSGGERTSVALAYRLALNEVVTSFQALQTKDLLMLDEPTDGFSPQQLDKMQDVLHQVHARQVIIVSHDQKMESFVNNVITVEKEQHESRLANTVWEGGASS